jgi:hypothetical protein
LCSFFVLPSLNFVRVHPDFRAHILLENQAKKIRRNFRQTCLHFRFFLSPLFVV